MDATKGTVCSVIWVSANLDTNQWDPLGDIGSNDVTAIRLKNDNLRIAIFNVYNDCNNDDSLTTLDTYHDKYRLDLTGLNNDHIIWAGDFNRHHPLWDDERETRLFTARATDDANRLIDLVGRWGLDFALPKSEGPTLQHKVTKSFSRPDLVLCSHHSLPLFVSCRVVADEKPTHTDHYPIAYELDVHEGIAMAKSELSFNFRATDWESFNQALEQELDPRHLLDQLANAVDLEASVEQLTKAIQHTICTSARKNKPHPNSKRWWNDDLSRMMKDLKELRKEKVRNRALPDHPIHRELSEREERFTEAVREAKSNHWWEFLENAMDKDVWSANKYVSKPVSDGGRPRIPALKVKLPNGSQSEVNTNEEKARALAGSFFPKRPALSTVLPNFHYPQPMDDPLPIDEERICRHIAALSPFKAPGPDGIPNVMLQKCANLLTPFLLQIY